MTKWIVRTTYPNLLLTSSVDGVIERVGSEGLEQMGEQQRRTSTLVDLLVEIHIEWSVERFTAHGDVSIVPEWNPRGGAHTADDDHP